MDKSEQQNLDIKNLRFYVELFHKNGWETDVLHNSVFKATLAEIANRITESQEDAADLRAKRAAAERSLKFRVGREDEVFEALAKYGERDETPSDSTWHGMVTPAALVHSLGRCVAAEKESNRLMREALEEIQEMLSCDAEPCGNCPHCIARAALKGRDAEVKA